MLTSGAFRCSIVQPAAQDMLLSAYAAAVDRPAFITSAIEDVTGRPARTFKEWATDHAAEFAAP